MSGSPCRYCIGCRHLRFEDKRIGAHSAWTGPWTASDAKLACGKDHWKLYLQEDQELDMENAMLHAATCPDYEPRKEDSK